MAKCLVTGHKGYIGSKLYSKLVEMGHDVFGVDFVSDIVEEKLDIRHHLFHNKKPWLSFEPEYIFHLAAKPSVSWSVENPSDSLTHNVLGSSRVLEFAKAVNAKRVIFASSAAASAPTSPYGLHKYMTEKECQLYSELYNIDTVSLRYFNVYSKEQKYGGPYSTVISAWMEMLKQDKPLVINGDGLQTRDFIHVDDIVSANVFCMNHKKNFNGNVFDVGTGIETSLNKIKNVIDEITNVNWQHNPERIGDIKYSVANVYKLKKLGWSSQVRIENGLKQCFGE